MIPTRVRTPRRYDVTASQALHFALLAALGLLGVFTLGVAAATGALGAVAIHFGGLVAAVVLGVAVLAVRAFGRGLVRAVAA